MRYANLQAANVLGLALVMLMLAAPALAAESVNVQYANPPALNQPTSQPCTQPAACAPCPLSERDSLTNHWFGLGEKLAEKGIETSLALTQVYQINVEGGLATHRHAGRYEGSYDLELNFDLEKMMGWHGGSVYMLAEGGWSEGIDPSSVGSFFNVNFDAWRDLPIAVTELRYEQSFLDDKVRVRVGKLDLRGGFMCRGCPVSFDGNAFANDPTTQFLNGALCNNPTIPFPDRGLGAIVHVEWLEWFYTSAGVADADTVASQTGFNTAFHGEDSFFSIYETGVLPQFDSAKGPLQGAYRLGFWYDPREKERFDLGDVKRDDTGLYTSFDQMLCRENDTQDDTQGLGVFNRLGWADEDVNVFRFFWSAGVQYQGLLPGRDCDVLAFGVAQGRLTQDLGAGFTADRETAMEAYYNIQVAPWIQITPDIEIVTDPGGDANVDPAVVLGVRAQIQF